MIWAGFVHRLCDCVSIGLTILRLNLNLPSAQHWGSYDTQQLVCQLLMQSCCKNMSHYLPSARVPVHERRPADVIPHLARSHGKDHSLKT